MNLGVSGFQNAGEEEEIDPAYGIDSYVHEDRHKIWEKEISKWIEVGGFIRLFQM